MKIFKITFLTLFGAIATALVSAQGISMCVIPQPLTENVSYTEYVPLEKVTVSCADREAVNWAKSHLEEWYGKYAPEVKSATFKGNVDGDEAYTLSMDEKETRICSKTLKGVRYALYSLRQMAIAKRGTATVSGWIVPKGTIEDRPALSFRGIHMCWFPETKAWEIERLIRLAAYYKLNYAIVESWGTFKSEIAPWFGWPDGGMTKSEIKRLRDIADDLGITLIPQFNMYGHATLSTVGTGKHSTLDFAPEYQSLFEPAAGWNWCMSNPETRKLLISIMKEMHEAFGNPPYFHIGCDEADAPSCPDCKARSLDELFIEHISEINDSITARGAHTMMWHDMLLDGNDRRWDGFEHNGNSKLAEALLRLPKDLIVCDWFYGGKMDNYPTLKWFKDLGFPVITCPCNNVAGIKAQGEQASKLGLYGILGTLWNKYFGPEMRNSFVYLSNSAWNPEKTADGQVSGRGPLFSTHLRHIVWDMKIRDYEKTGFFHHQIEPETTQYR